MTLTPAKTVDIDTARHPNSRLSGGRFVSPDSRVTPLQRSISTRTLLVIVVAAAIPIHRASGISLLHVLLALLSATSFSGLVRLNGQILWFAAISLAMSLATVSFDLRTQSIGPLSSLALQPISILLIVLAPSLFRLDAWATRRYILAVVSGSALSYLVFPTVGSRENIIKFGFGPLLALLALFWLGPKARPRSIVAVCVALATVFVASSFRSMAGICVVTAISVFYGARHVGSRRGHADQRAKVRVIGAALVAAVVGLWFLYPLLAGSGVLGDGQRERLINQGGGSRSALLNARPEFVIGLTVALESPFVGRGSQPGLGLRSETVGRALSNVEKYSPNVSAGLVLDRLNGRVNVHSLLLYGWICSGVVGLFYWLMLSRFAISAAIGGSWEQSRDSATRFLGLWVGWDILFSPWSPHSATVLAVLVLLVTSKAEKSGPGKLEHVA